MNEDEAKSKSGIDRKSIKDDQLSGKFLGPGIVLFLDYFVVSLGGWLYWIIISKIASVTEIGVASTIISLVITTSSITQLGLEYPLLKRSNTDKNGILGTSLLIELGISMAALPVVWLVIDSLYDGTLEQFYWITSALLLLNGVEFVIRFILLGIYRSKRVLILDAISLAIKFPVGIALIIMGYGAFGLLIAYLAEFLFISVAYLLVVRKTFVFKLGTIIYFKKIIKESIVNAPSKWSKMVIISLSVVLLASIGVAPYDVGIFYVALMISTLIGSFASSMAFMVIPASAISKKDLSFDSLRISLSLIAPIIVILIVFPDLVLSLIGSDYVSGALLLAVLAIGTVPASITINTITKLNNLGESRKLVLVGILQISTFLVCFYITGPIFGTLGAAFSISLGFTVPSIPSIIWSGKESAKHIAFCCLSITIGSIIGYAIHETILGSIFDPLLPIASAVGVTSVVIILSGNFSLGELREMIPELLGRR